MPRTSRWIAAALSLVVAVSLSACVTEPEPPPRTSSATPAPDSVFESDADALAAAIAAYEAYEDMATLILNAGGRGGEQIREFVTPTYATQLEGEFAIYLDRKIRTAGRSTFSESRLERRIVEADREHVSAFMCLDFSAVRVLDAEGSDVTPPERRDVIPVRIEFESESNDSSELLVSGSEPWAGDDFCS